MHYKKWLVMAALVLGVSAMAQGKLEIFSWWAGFVLS